MKWLFVYILNKSLLIYLFLDFYWVIHGLSVFLGWKHEKFNVLYGDCIINDGYGLKICLLCNFVRDTVKI